MADKIKLVQGDNLPFIKLTLTDPITSLPIDLSDTDTIVRVYFRAVGADTILSTINCMKIDGGANGQVKFNFGSNELDVDPGLYEGEVNIDFGGFQQTVYDVLKFQVRKQFA